MSERERLLTLLSGGVPDRVPWFGDLAYWYPSALSGGLIERRYEGDGLFALHRDLGVGFYLQGYMPFREETDCEIEKTALSERRETLTSYRTPVGALTQLDAYLPQSHTSAIKKHPVTNLEEFETYVYILEHTAFTTDYGEAERRGPLIGDNGVVLCYLPRSPYMDLLAVRSGIGNVVDMRLDDEARFDSLLARSEARYGQAAEIALRSPAECLMLPENISSEVVGREPYFRYMDGWHRRWNARILQANKTSFVHLDGTMRGLISQLSEAGARVLEALTPGPAGDIEIEDLRAYTRDDTILWGGIPGLFFTDLVSDRQFDEHVRRVLETMTSQPRYVLGVADQVPPGCRPERIARVRTLVDRYGAYR